MLTPSGLLRCRSVRRKPPSERWSRSILECSASEMQPNSLQEGETRIGIRAPVDVLSMPNEPVAVRNRGGTQSL